VKSLMGPALSVRGVTDVAAKGQLKGAKVLDAYCFEVCDVAAYRAQRAGR
jgi:hypothetical protein